MQVDRVTALVKYSSEIKGSWKSIELGAEASLGPGESWRAAQSQLYRDVSNLLKQLWAQNGSGQPPALEDLPPVAGGFASDTDPQPLPAHFCQQHGAPFTPKTGPHGEFYSHKVEGSTAWCNKSRASEAKR
jgi:hypothetical protein